MGFRDPVEVWIYFVLVTGWDLVGWFDFHMAWLLARGVHNEFLKRFERTHQQVFNCRRIAFCCFFQWLIDVHPTATIESQQKALNCAALGSSHSLGYVPIMRRNKGYWQIQSHYFHQTRTHRYYTPLYAVNLLASSTVVLSHCRQRIYACMGSWLAQTSVVPILLYISFPNNPALAQLNNK